MADLLNFSMLGVCGVSCLLYVSTKPESPIHFTSYVFIEVLKLTLVRESNSQIMPFISERRKSGRAHGLLVAVNSIKAAHGTRQ